MPKVVESQSALPADVRDAIGDYDAYKAILAADADKKK